MKKKPASQAKIELEGVIEIIREQIDLAKKDAQANPMKVVLNHQAKSNLANLLLMINLGLCLINDKIK